ncbi:MAG: transcriptional regulator [Anaerolineae bacterium]|nr:transcriptional regulator [Anaerolineae bacterium]
MDVQETMNLRSRVVGVLLQDARIQAGRSKRECSEIIGVSVSTITAYEEGRKAISLPELEGLAHFLNVPVARFWDEQADLLADDEPLPMDKILALRHRIVGVLLRQAREEAGLSQKELAAALGCSASRISSFEYGKRPIPLAELEIVAEVLGQPVEYFLDAGSNPLGRAAGGEEIDLEDFQLSAEVLDFVSKPINQKYVEVAMRLAGMSAEELRNIAEVLLDITY